MTHSIPFTEFVLPNGRKRAIKMPCSEEIATMGKALIDNGFWFECETLSQGHISLTVCGLFRNGEGDDEPCDYDIEIAHSMPTRGDALETLVRRFYATLR